LVIKLEPANDREKLHAGDVENMGLLFHSIAYSWNGVSSKMFDMEFTLNISQT
jgi:hypothetical protein